MDEGDAALVGGGGVACGVAYDAASQCDEGGFAVGVMLQEGGVDLVEGVAVFVLFAIGKDDGGVGDIELVTGVLDVVQVEGGNGGVADDGDAVGKMGA